jgi:hypothetical protein
MNQRVRFLNHNPQGRINLPRNRDSVPRLFRAEGTIDNLPAGQHLLLVVQVGGLMWPKGQVQVNNASWTTQVHEGGHPPNGRFALSLWLVSSRGYDEVAAWLEHGKRTGDYPGLGQIKDGVKLHSITLRLES